MRHRYYYDGGPFADATVHRSKDCPELETPHPLADSTVEDIDADQCSECMGSELSEESETCEVVKSDGEVCGRERPCHYHESN